MADKNDLLDRVATLEKIRLLEREGIGTLGKEKPELPGLLLGDIGAIAGSTKAAHFIVCR